MGNPATVDVSVLIPVFNEDDGIERCHKEVVRVLESSPFSFEIVFVDDGSTDDSVARLRDIATSDERVTFVKLAYNVGQQRAMYAALGHCSGRAVVTFDADLQFQPECLPDLVAKIFEGYDIVGGVRVERRDPIFANRIPSWVGRTLINKALRINQIDFGGVKAYSGRLVQVLLAMTPPIVVIPAMAYSVSRRAVEIPVRHERRQWGRSKWSTLSRLELYLDVYTLYARRPFAWMQLMGVASFVLSVVLGTGVLAYRAFVSSAFSGLIIFFTVFLFATGIYLFSLSLIGEFVVRNLRGTRVDPGHLVDEVVRGSQHRGGSGERP
jgi:undecaprenyl-phosphate 4-deoxy-4-formamido-L-arabinose transferase